MHTHLCTVATAALLVFAAQGARGQCCGDCDGNGTVAINELITAVNNALGECETQGCGVPATGQRTSYGPGSDGAVRAGVPLSATDNGDGTITDNATGLIWEKKDRAGGVHDWDNTYTWTQDIGLPQQMNGTIVTEFLAALNTRPCFAGHCDWRIPNIRELEGLADYEMFGVPAVRAEFNTPQCGMPGCSADDAIARQRCSCTNQFGNYVSSTTYEPGGGVWFVRADGAVDGYQAQKTRSYYVRAVRGGL